MRRVRLILTLAVLCVAGLVVVSSGAAQSFADAPCTEQIGDNKICPSATAGVPYALDIRLQEPWPGCHSIALTSGDFPPGLTVSSDGNIRGTPTTPGSYSFYLTVSWSATPPCITKTPGDQKFTIKVNGDSGAPPPPPPPPPPVQHLAVSTASLPDANLSQAYTAPALTASGGSVSSWSLAGGTLPAGVTLGSNGVISGTPTQGGTFTFTVQANGSPNNDTKQLSLFVLAPLEVQTLFGAKAPQAGLTAKAALAAALTTGVKAVGGRGPYAFASAGALPPGITLDPATGLLTGRATTAGRFSATVTVTDATGAKASVPWTFTILPLLEFAKGKGLPAGTVGRLYSARIPISGKEAKNATFTIAGKLPPGLALDGSGRLAGTFAKPGTYRVKVIASSPSGARVSKSFRVSVRR
jgi:hypothetical protein